MVGKALAVLSVMGANGRGGLRVETIIQQSECNPKDPEGKVCCEGFTDASRMGKCKEYSWDYCHKGGSKNFYPGRTCVH